MFFFFLSFLFWQKGHRNVPQVGEGICVSAEQLASCLPLWSTGSWDHRLLQGVLHYAGIKTNLLLYSVDKGAFGPGRQAEKHPCHRILVF